MAAPIAPPLSVLPAHVLGGEDTEGDPEEAEIERGREHDRADLPAEPITRAEAGEARENGRPESAPTQDDEQEHGAAPGADEVRTPGVRDAPSWFMAFWAARKALIPAQSEPATPRASASALPCNAFTRRPCPITGSWASVESTIDW